MSAQWLTAAKTRLRTLSAFVPHITGKRIMGLSVRG
jgi:hypothetical protein